MSLAHTTLKVIVQMDPIQNINIKGDSTFAMMLEAQARGHTLYHMTPDRLAMVNGEVFGTVEPVSVRDEVGNHATLGEADRMALSEADIILLRQDPPFDLNYITTTHLLERVHPDTLVVNDPAAVRNAPEKILVTEFADLMPPTLISRNVDEINRFRKEQNGDVVIKPLYGHGGKAVFRIAQKDQNFGSLIDLFEDRYPEAWVIQAFMPEVSQGDKRILIVDGEFAGAINRVPAEEDLRSNMVRGGSAQATELTDGERRILDRIGPRLKELGFIFVGIDVIGDKITEINVTSPTGIRAVKNHGGPDAAALMWDAVEARYASTRS